MFLFTLLRWIGLSLAFLLLATIALVGWLLWASLPKHAGRIAVDGLTAPVSIARDPYAIPHIEAQNEHDAYFALGFVHAQDRLWQMEVNRLAGQGRLAEVLGPAALPIDRLMRTLGLHKLARASEQALDPEERALLEAYAAGVNAWLERRTGPLPPEFLLLRHAPEAWSVIDSLTFARLMAFDIAGEWRGDLARARILPHVTAEQFADLYPTRDASDPVTIKDWVNASLGEGAALPDIPSATGLGSNAFAVSGERSASGKPILASDPHLALTAPGVWYLAHLRAPGLDVVGGTLPGLPAVVIGRNETAAWGMTTAYVDTQDLFVEKLDPDGSGRYLAPDGWRSFQTREETIRVRGGAPERLVVRSSRHGPIISDVYRAAASAVPEGHVLAFAWTGLDPSDKTAAAGFALAHVHDWASFRAALRNFDAPVQNVLYADKANHIGIQTAGRVPLRPKPQGRLPLPGWEQESDWTGIIPYDEMPHAIDPPTGRLINANNRVVGEDYPYYLGADWPPSDRARRIEDLLGKESRIDRDGMEAIQTDVVSSLARDLRPLLLAVPARDDRLRGVLDAMRQWDLAMRSDRPEPLIFAMWYEILSTRLARDELGNAADYYRGEHPDFVRRAVEKRQEWCDNIVTAALEDCAQLAAEALDQALGTLSKAYGDSWRAWRWGDAHPAVLAHRPFEQVTWLRQIMSVRVPVGGGQSTVNVAHANENLEAATFPVVHAAGLRMVVDLAAQPRIEIIAAGGQVGHPLSAHYRDMTRLWQRGKYVTVSMEAVLEDANGWRYLELAPNDG